jgi:hypothetical protein
MNKRKNNRLKLVFTGVLLLMLLLNTLIFAEGPSYPNVIFSASTVEEEANYVWHLIHKIDFFNQNGYRISLPSHSMIDDLKTKSLQHQLQPEDYGRLKEVFAEEIYRPDSYEPGLLKLEEAREKVLKCFPVFINYRDKWGFKIFPQYKVRLTLYGPGGSYNNLRGEIIMLTTETGGFARTEPSMVIVHEMVHIGIEEKIVKKYDLAHWVKERIVDKFVDYHFKSLFPDYQMSYKGDTTIDPYLNHPDSWERLPSYIRKYVKSIR